MNTYNPLLHLFPEDFKLLELQHPSVVNLVYTSRKKKWRCSCFQAAFITRVSISILFFSILFYCESVKRVWKDTSIRLMMLWQVESVNPSNLISFPGVRKAQEIKSKKRSAANSKEESLKWREGRLTSAEDTVQHLLQLPGGDGLVL